MPKTIKVAEATWEQMKYEYISTDISLRGIQKKYGVPYNQTRTRCINEQWNEYRDAFRTQSTQKSVDLLSNHKAEECIRAFRIANKVMDKLEEIVEEIDVEDEYATKKLKSITSSIKDLKEIGVFRSALDQAEQEARIKKLQKDAEEEETDTNITVTFMEDGYAN